MTAKLSNADTSYVPELQLFYARWRAVVSIVFIVGCMFATAYACIGLTFVIGKELALITCMPLVLFMLWRVYRAIKILRWQGPVVILDDNGITDLRQGNVTIPWDALRGFSRGTYRNQMGVVLKFLDMHTAQHQLGISARVDGITLKMQFENGEYFIGLSPLRCSFKTVAASMTAFLKRAAMRRSAHSER